jgi:magnesium transporter
MKTIQLFLSDLKELLESREFHGVRSALRLISPYDLVDGWEEFGLEERKVLFKLMPRQRALQLFEELELEHQEELLKSLQPEDVEELVEDLDPTETGRIMRELPDSMVNELEKILKKADGGEKVEQYLRYPDESVGALMRSNHLVLRPDMTGRQALEYIHGCVPLREIEARFLQTLFVVDQDEMLKGTVLLKELVVAPPATHVRDLMNTEPQTLDPEIDQEKAAQLFAHYKLDAAPVVDRNHRLLGVVLDSDIVEVVEEEIEEDLAKMAGTDVEEFETDSAWEAAWHRMPWLGVTLVGQLVVALIIRSFEVTISQIVALATFIPLIAALGGNVGAQSAIIVVREMSSGDWDPESGREIVRRDMIVGVILGLAACVVMAGMAWLFYGTRFGTTFCIVTGLGTLASMSVAATLGALVPLLFKRVGMDPATATGPLVTTMTDIIGTASYLMLAAYLLTKF